TGIAGFEVTGPVVVDAMAEREVLRPGWCADRVELDEAELGDGARQRRWFEEATRDGIAAEVVEGEGGGHVVSRFLPGRCEEYPVNGLGDDACEEDGDAQPVLARERFVLHGEVG